MVERRLDPCMSEVFGWSDIPLAHSMMLRNEHKLGNMAVLVQSPRTELRTFEDALFRRDTLAPTLTRLSLNLFKICFLSG